MNQTTTYVYIDFLVLLTGVCGCTPEGRGNGSNGPRIAYDQNNKLLSMLIQNILRWLLGKSHCWSWEEDCGWWSGKDCGWWSRDWWNLWLKDCLQWSNLHPWTCHRHLYRNAEISSCNAWGTSRVYCACIYYLFEQWLSPTKKALYI